MDTQHVAVSLLQCRFGRDSYALPLAAVREVLRWRVPVRVPGMPPTLLGIFHHRGAILPIVDVRPLLGFDAVPPTRDTRLVIVEQHSGQAALVADAVADILDMDTGALRAVPGQIQFSTEIVYVDEQPLGVMDLDQVLQSLSHAQ